MVQAAVAPVQAPSDSGHLPIAQAIRSLRLRAGLSQRQLATRMCVPRTYVSKIENEKACPTLSSLERLAEALHVRIPDLLNGTGRTLQDEIRELQSDEFIAELIPYLSKLGPLDCASIMSRVREMSVMPHRTT